MPAPCLHLHSPRLIYRPVAPSDVDALLRLVTEDHVKRYLFDGADMDRTWCADAVETSRRSFETRGAGLWLVSPAGGNSPAGFCGYWVFDELGPEPQLLYAFTAEHSGNGYATEAAEALVAAARVAGLPSVCAAVDEPNAASVRVLEKVGFAQTGTAPGAFGRTLLFRLPL